MICLSIPKLLELIGERPAKCRPTSPLHSEGPDVGGLTNARVVVGWDVAGEEDDDLEDDLVRSLTSAKEAPFKLLEVEPFLRALETMLGKTDLCSQVDLSPKDFVSQLRKKVEDKAGSPEALLREVHEEDVLVFINEASYAIVLKAACVLFHAAVSVAEGKASADNFVIFESTSYNQEYREKYGIRSVYLGKSVKDACATSTFAKNVLVAAEDLKEVGRKTGQKGEPKAHVDGHYEEGTIQED